MFKELLEEKVLSELIEIVDNIVTVGSGAAKRATEDYQIQDYIVNFTIPGKLIPRLLVPFITFTLVNNDSVVTESDKFNLESATTASMKRDKRLTL